MKPKPHARPSASSVPLLHLPLERDLQAWRSASLVGSLLRSCAAQPRIYRAFPTSVVVRLRRAS